MVTANDENTFNSLIENVVTTPDRKLSIHTERLKNKKRMNTGGHAGVGKIPSIGCIHCHDIKSLVISHADIFTCEDIGLNFQQLYREFDKVKQDEIVISYIKTSDPKCRRVNNKERRRSRETSVQYTLLRLNGLH